MHFKDLNSFTNWRVGSGALRDTIVTAILGSLNNSDLKGDCHMFTVYIYTLSL